MSPLLRRPTFEWFAVTVMCMVIVVLAALEGWLCHGSHYRIACQKSINSFEGIEATAKIMRDEWELGQVQFLT